MPLQVGNLFNFLVQFFSLLQMLNSAFKNERLKNQYHTGAELMTETRYYP